MAVNIHQLAKHLDISIGTVSRALNGKPDVNPKTRERVLKAAQELGYEPNQSGRALRRGAIGAVAFVMELGDETSDESAAFFMNVHRGVQTAVEPAGLDYLVLMCPEEQEPGAFMRRVVARKLADGYILSGTRRIDPRVAYLEERQIPFVAFGRSQSGKTYDWIDMDFERIATASVRLLASLGHRRIAITLPTRDINYGHLFLESYRDTMAACGLAVDDGLVIRCPLHGGGGNMAARAILDMSPRPTALLLINDLMAEGLYAGLRAGGIEPGRDLAVIGHRVIAQNAHLEPPLTSFKLSAFDLGQALGQRLILKLPDAKPQTDLAVFMGGLWPCEMVLGSSHLRVPGR